MYNLLAVKGPPVSWIALILLAAFPSALPAQDDYQRLTPKAFWSFNDCLGPGVRRLPDSTGQYHLTRRGAVCAAEGKYGPALRFGSFLRSSTQTREDVLNFTDKLTLSAWVNPEDVSETQAVVHKWYTPDSYRLFVANGSFLFSVALSDGVTLDVSAPAPAGQWSHVTGVFDGAAPKGDVERSVTGAGGPVSSCRMGFLIRRQNAGSLQRSIQPRLGRFLLHGRKGVGGHRQKQSVTVTSGAISEPVLSDRAGPPAKVS